MKKLLKTSLKQAKKFAENLEKALINDRET